MNSLFQNPMRLLFGVVVLLVILSQSLAIVPEDKQALILRFGEIERTVNRYKPNEDFGRSGAGLVLRVPFTDGIQYIDKRILGVNMERQQVLSTDQQRLQVDAFARFRITNPVRMYTAIRTEDKLQAQLATILGSSLRNELGKRTFATLLSPERGAVMDNIQVALNREANKYGAEIIDVRIKRADLPEGATLEAAYNRMRTARQQEASRSVPKGRRKRRSSAAAPTAKRRASMRRALARTPTSMTSTVRCRAIGRPSSGKTTRAGRRSSCRRTMNI